MAQPFLKARGLIKRFGKVAAVNDVSFKVHKGEVLLSRGIQLYHLIVIRRTRSSSAPGLPRPSRLLVRT